MRLRLYFSCLLLFVLTIFSSGCNNILSPDVDQNAEDKADGSYTWWNSRMNEEQMNDGYNTQFGDQPSFENEERGGGDAATGITF
jgi:hypothetical protein